MGWWNTTREGLSLQVQETGLIWGDGPADTLDEAIATIREQFHKHVGREPLKGELRAGLEFSLMGGADIEPVGGEDDDHDR